MERVESGLTGINPPGKGAGRLRRRPAPERTPPPLVRRATPVPPPCQPRPRQYLSPNGTYGHGGCDG